MSFDQAFVELIRLEGGFVDDPQDPGGRTNWGISSRTYPELFADGRLPTREQAKEIYYRDFWQPLKLNRFRQTVATELFEVSVNAGRRVAVTLLQRALNFLGEGLKVDGKFGPRTHSSVTIWQDSNITVLVKAMNGEQYGYFRRVVTARKRRGLDSPYRFSAGWLRRVEL